MSRVARMVVKGESAVSHVLVEGIKGTLVKNKITSRYANQIIVIILSAEGEGR